MLFSGSVKSYKCTKCDNNFSEVTPTSVIPMLIVIIIATSLWAENIAEFFKLKSIGLLLALVSGFLLAVAIFVLTFVLLQKAFYPWKKRLKCSECGGKLEGKSGGFIDGAAPGFQELLLYVIVIILPLGITLLIGGR